MHNLTNYNIPHEPLGNYLRSHRRRAGVTQREAEIILGLRYRGIVSRHERLESLPPLLAALSYEVLYRVPVSELFAGLTSAVASSVEERLAEFEIYLGEQRASGPNASAVARKLQWLAERRSSQSA